jgi:hypothetical protein
MENASAFSLVSTHIFKTYLPLVPSLPIPYRPCHSYLVSKEARCDRLRVNTVPTKSARLGSRTNTTDRTLISFWVDDAPSLSFTQLHIVFDLSKVLAASAGTYVGPQPSDLIALKDSFGHIDLAERLRAW